MARPGSSLNPGFRREPSVRGADTMGIMTDATAPKKEQTDVVETLKSLIIAFVLAMTFRAFVTEGFVIPTGSMAPTLLGQHIHLESPTTGYEYPVGVSQSEWSKLRTQTWNLPDGVRANGERLNWLEMGYSRMYDPVLGSFYRGTGAPTTGTVSTKPRSGDRILVHKSLYPFVSPKRFDVVVFKNPTNPNGDDGNYIKRLIGLPDESIWLVDGDVFAAPSDQANDWSAYQIQRKPEHVQRAIWQPIYRSDYQPRAGRMNSMPIMSPWINSMNWDDVDKRIFRCETADPSFLQWDYKISHVQDRNPYNELSWQVLRDLYMETRERYLASTGAEMDEDREEYRNPWNLVRDIRVAGTVVPESEGLETYLRLVLNQHVFQVRLDGEEAVIRMRPEVIDQEGESINPATGEPIIGPEDGWTESERVAIDPFPVGEPTTLEFWHVDQELKLFIDGDLVLSFAYDWAPNVRLGYAVDLGEPDVERLASSAALKDRRLEWHFAGSPLTMHRVKIDRDLFYRQDNQQSAVAAKNPTRSASFEDADSAPGKVSGGEYGFGTHPSNLAVLGEDHFYLLGDNSAASSDSRLWGYPHPLVAAQIDPAPFVVHRSLLLGKAWVVYFPSPIPAREGWRNLIPDFGSLRFIR